jgi:acyl-[acyl-carrier-protein]-phospholipid O-acyltransferase/long-chain-fatty-acid--[acyl-carrier-protein] ligase
MIPTIEPLENNQLSLSAIKHTLQQGISVCIFIENPDLTSAVEKLTASNAFQEILDTTTIVPVTIDKGTRKPLKFFSRLTKKFRVPASVTFHFSASEPNV